MKEHSVNFERGVKAAKNGMGVSDAWGDVETKNSNNIPSKEELDEWIKGWETVNINFERRSAVINHTELTWENIEEQFCKDENNNFYPDFQTFTEWLKQNFEPPKPTKNINL
jgi:hypothetical protein